MLGGANPVELDFLSSSNLKRTFRGSVHSVWNVSESVSRLESLPEELQRELMYIDMYTYKLTILPSVFPTSLYHIIPMRNVLYFL